MNTFYKVGASVYRGFVVTHWVFRRPGVLWLITKWFLIIMGIIGIGAIIAGATGHKSHHKSNGGAIVTGQFISYNGGTITQGDYARLLHRIVVLEHACAPVYTGGGVTQCAQPNVFDNTTAMTEEDLARINRVLAKFGRWVNRVETGANYVSCHIRDVANTHNSYMQWEHNMDMIDRCLSYMQSNTYPIAQLHIHH